MSGESVAVASPPIGVTATGVIVIAVGDGLGFSGVTVGVVDAGAVAVAVAVSVGATAVEGGSVVVIGIQLASNIASSNREAYLLVAIFIIYPFK